ncbi:helix-turn-helix domain-containing protein [Amycolatopsis nigrescens]|uniref:PucR family transcriptional regulator n=1 Tax=Amycolatopsis nigrescens TaxID=381445 RepID=UPI00058AE77C|nr:helix-turn-helix domain-containing protein [Amycolatopsis nigrescens]
MTITDNHVVPRQGTRPHPQQLSAPKSVNAIPPARTGPPAPSEFARSRPLWSTVPRELAERFRPQAEGMAKAMIREIQRAVPEYARPLDGPFGQAIIDGVRQAILCAVDNFGDPGAMRHDWVGMFRQLGKTEFEQGRSLDCLQSAYRVGGRVAWRHVAAFAQRNGVSADVVCVCAEAIFAYVDEISTLSIAGYAAAQAQAEGGRADNRRRLLQQILSGAPRSPRALAELARSAEWKVPDQVSLVALEPCDDEHQLGFLDLGAKVLIDLESPEPCLLVPEEELGGIEAALTRRGMRAAVGPAVPLDQATVSLRWARRTLELVRDGVLPNLPVSRWSEHLATHWLLTDQFLVGAISERSLAPLEGLTPKQRTRMSETLLAWLKTRGGAPELAALLDIHPQTARYRMRQLEELFGDRLNDSDERLNLEITLRAERLNEARRQS